MMTPEQTAIEIRFLRDHAIGAADFAGAVPGDYHVSDVIAVPEDVATALIADGAACLATIEVEFLRDHSIGFYDFHGAVQFQGGFHVGDIVGVPVHVAERFIERGIARAPVPRSAVIAPAMVLVRFHNDRTIAPGESHAFASSYLAGDEAGFPEPLADCLVAEGTAARA